MRRHIYSCSGVRRIWIQAGTDGNFQAKDPAQGEVPMPHCCQMRCPGIDDGQLNCKVLPVVSRFFHTKKAVLMLDSMHAHITPEVKDTIKTKNTIPAVIPGGSTHQDLAAAGYKSQP